MRKLAFLFVLSLTLWATTASAAIITYTSEAAWQSAVGSWLTEPFNSSGLQSFTNVLQQGGTHGSIGSSRGVLSGSVWRDRVTVEDEEVTTFGYVPGTLLGAGGFWDTTPAGDGQGLLIQLNLTGGGTVTVDQIGPIHGTFFGWTSTQPFDSFRIIAGNLNADAETFDFDNLSFANTPAPPAPPVATPEPGTLALLGTGMLGLGLLRRKWAGKR